MSALSERQWAALAWLSENTDPAPPMPRGREAFNAWYAALPARPRWVYAFKLAGHLGEAGRVQGAANTLVALKRRGLAGNDGGGVFLQAKWWITPAGVEALEGSDG